MATSLDRDKEAVLRALRPYLEGTGTRLFLFGSFARGEGRQASDLDLALLSPVPLKDLMPLLREALEEAPSLEEVLEKAYPLLADATLVIHNAAFDLGFLRPALEDLGYRLENPVVDSLRLARRGLPGLRRYGLDALSEVLELPRRTCHRALEDVERTLAVVHEVYYMLTSGRPRTLWELGR